MFHLDRRLPDANPQKLRSDSCAPNSRACQLHSEQPSFGWSEDCPTPTRGNSDPLPAAPPSGT
eukprot:15033593-Alexandrium_andersonii.AAC.1